MRTSIVVLVFIGLLSVFVGLSGGKRLAAQEFSEEALVALQVFIDTDCEIGEEPISALDGVLVFVDELEPTIIDIAVGGPPADVIDGYQAELDDLWAQRAAYMEGKNAEDMRAEGLDDDAAAIALSVTEEEYKARQDRTLLLKYREKAAILLAYLEADGSEEATRVLDELVTDPDIGPVVVTARSRIVDGQ